MSSAGSRDASGVGTADALEKASAWFSGAASALAGAVESASSANRWMADWTGSSSQKQQMKQAGLQDLEKFEWLPTKEHQALLHLRQRAETLARNAPGDELEVGLKQLRMWGESVHWPGEAQDDMQLQDGVGVWGDVSPHWKKLGFQSADPRRDFRTGILAVDNLVHMCQHHPTELEQMCIEAGSASLTYPFAVASINLTQVLAWYLSLIPGPSPLGEDCDIRPLDDFMQLHAFARLCTDVDAFGELHNAALIRLHCTWHEAKVADPAASLMAFSNGLQQALAAVDHVIRTAALESSDEFKHIRHVHL